MVPVHSSLVMAMSVRPGYEKTSRLPQFEQTVLGVGPDEVLMWMMNNTDHVFLMNLLTQTQALSSSLVG